MLVGKEAKTSCGLIKSKSRKMKRHVAFNVIPEMDQESASSPITPKHADQSYYAQK